MSQALNVAMVMMALVPSASHDERHRDLSTAERQCSIGGLVVQRVQGVGKSLYPTVELCDELGAIGLVVLGLSH
jgi:hypothetical protein